MNSRYLALLVVLLAVAVLWLLFRGGPQVEGASQKVVVLCSSCSYGPASGLALLDTDTGDVWIYTDEAWMGKAKPFHWGRLVLGETMVRATPSR